MSAASSITAPVTDAQVRSTIPDRITFDAAEIRAYVDGHFNWSVEHRKLTGAALAEYRAAFYAGAVTALTCVFAKDNAEFPPQIHPPWIRKAMCGV
jgi:hypothetical protein